MHNLYQHIHTHLIYKDGRLYRHTNCSSPHLAPAGTTRKDGYRQIMIKGKLYYEHRLIFLYHNGYMPALIDHIDRNPNNNRISNLREATYQQNAINSKLSCNNQSGYKGVSWDKQTKKWRATIQRNGKKKSLGRYATIEEAISARKQAE